MKVECILRIYAVATVRGLYLYCTVLYFTTFATSYQIICHHCFTEVDCTSGTLLASYYYFILRVKIRSSPLPLGLTYSTGTCYCNTCTCTGYLSTQLSVQ